MGTASAEQTERLAEAIGAQLHGGEVIELVSDLGGGKTTFVRGLARGAGSRDHVASPTFTIKREYQAGDLTLHHFDFYRLAEAGLIAAELDEVAHDSKAIVIVEWSDIVQHVLPEKRLIITIEQSEAETGRKLSLQYPLELEYLITEMWKD